MHLIFSVIVSFVMDVIYLFYYAKSTDKRLIFHYKKDRESVKVKENRGKDNMQTHIFHALCLHLSNIKTYQIQENL